jgi:hypothetical protein
MKYVMTEDQYKDLIIRISCLTSANELLKNENAFLRSLLLEEQKQRGVENGKTNDSD